MNKVILVGRMATDVELKYLQSGVAVATFRVAVNRPFKNSEGKYEADFLDICTYRQPAEFAANFLGRGRLVLVEGRIQVRSYDTQDGQKRRVTEVIVNNLRGLDRPREGSENTQQAPTGGSDDGGGYDDPFQDE